MSGNFFQDKMYELQSEFNISDDLFELLLKEADRAITYFNQGTEANEAIKRVRELHVPMQTDFYDGDLCAECVDPYPCPTIKALDGEQL